MMIVCLKNIQDKNLRKLDYCFSRHKNLDDMISLQNSERESEIVQIWLDGNARD